MKKNNLKKQLFLKAALTWAKSLNSQQDKMQLLWYEILVKISSLLAKLK